MQKNNIWTAFKVVKYKEKKKEWIDEYFFIYGDITNNFDVKDWRFCEVKNKRKQVTLLGKGIVNFPVVFPLVLDNKVVLEELSNNYNDL